MEVHNIKYAMAIITILVTLIIFYIFIAVIILELACIAIFPC